MQRHAAGLMVSSEVPIRLRCPVTRGSLGTGPFAQAARHIVSALLLLLMRIALACKQAQWRGLQVRQAADRQRSAALTLQKHWRAARLRQLFRADVARIVLAQAAMRRSVCIPHAND